MRNVTKKKKSTGLTIFPDPNQNSHSLGMHEKFWPVEAPLWMRLGSFRDSPVGSVDILLVSITKVLAVESGGLKGGTAMDLT